MDGLNSNLNLNGRVSPRVMPATGAWGPDGVPTTRTKKRARWWTLVVAVVALAAVVAFGWNAYFLLRGF